MMKTASCILSLWLLAVDKARAQLSFELTNAGQIGTAAVLSNQIHPH